MATINVSQAQNLWTGATDNLFMTTTNWTTVPLFNGTDNLRITSMVNNPVLLNSTALTVLQFRSSVGTELTTNSDLTSSSTSLNVEIAGKLHVTGGTFWGKGNIYFGNNAGELPYCNIEAGGTLKTKAAILVGRNSPCTIDVNGGTITGESSGSIAIGNYFAAGPGIVNLNSGGLIKLYKVSGFLVGTYGTCNVNNGGKIEEPAGDLAVKGTLNVNGGLINLLAGASTINNTAAGAGVINLNSGTINIAGALNAINGTINVNAGSLVLTGDQTIAIGTYISTNVIKLAAEAVTAGKILSNTFDSGTNKTTVTAIYSNTIWNGSVWSNGTPSSSLDAIIDGTYSGAAFNAKKLTINSGKNLTVTSGNMTIQNEVVNNGTMVIENNTNLIQVLGTTNTNTGNIVVNRNSSPLLRLDYTLWSSPVTGQNLAAFSPLTSQSPSRFYTYDTANNQYSNAFDPTATNFAAGTGYLIRMPNTADSTTPTAYAGQFTGVPNNGDISFTLSTAGSGYNLVGNPYPSPITAATLVANNSTVISSTLYFWRKTNGIGTAYCTYNTAGSVFTTNGNTQSVDPTGIIQSGQGFFVQAIAPGSLVFKNGQRSTNTTGQFFKTKQVAAPSRIWLNAINAAGDFSQMAVNYTEGATQGVDAFDGKYINDSPLALTSNINNDEYTIQGRPAFDASDVVPLNFKTNVAGDYTIAIDHADGLFATGQDVYLVDNTTGTETNLKTNAYTFTATTGTANSRFALKYQKTLKVDAPAFNENSVAAYKNNETLYVNSGVNNISNIKVFDIQGRLIVEQKNVNTNSSAIKNLKASQQVLIVKVTSQDNKVVNKKVVH